MKSRIRVLVADDHELVREGLKVMLSTDQELEVVGCVQDGEEVVALVDQCKPNVVLMDVRMPGMNGIEATRLIKAKYPDVSVLMLSVYRSEVFPGLWLNAAAVLSGNLSQAVELLQEGLASDPHREFVRQIENRRNG